MIQARHLSKRYGPTTAVDDLSFDVRPGRVTGFLGPNGAGKSTTMRMILGLDAPTGGEVTIDGVRYADLPAPLRAVGALLDAKPSSRAAGPTTTCCGWPRAIGCGASASTRSSTSSD